jgi:SAM-dependent methyltransferase
VGCGDGQVTLELARTVGPAGRVVGIDIDEGALAIARDAAQDAGLCAEFIRADATAPPQRDAFDLAYARLVLRHLAEPAAALRAMRSAVRVGGLGSGRGPVHRHPAIGAAVPGSGSPSGGLQRHRSSARGRPTIGPRLRALLAIVGLDSLREDTVENPMTAVDDKLFLAELVDNMRAPMLASGAATAAELDAIRADVERAARDPGRVFHQARIHQVCGRRPG